jgi:hypothetical protein
LVDWIVKHDLLGEGSIIKTIFERGTGFDRPDKYDEIGFSIKAHQQGQILFESSVEWAYDVADTPFVTPVVQKILNSMKLHEKT